MKRIASLVSAILCAVSLSACLQKRENWDKVYDHARKKYYRIYNKDTDNRKTPIRNHIEECVVAGDKVTCKELEVKLTAPAI